MVNRGKCVMRVVVYMSRHWYWYKEAVPFAEEEWPLSVKASQTVLQERFEEAARRYGAINVSVIVETSPEALKRWDLRELPGSHNGEYGD